MDVGLEGKNTPSMHVLFAKQDDIEKVVPYFFWSVHRLVSIVFCQFKMPTHREPCLPRNEHSPPFREKEHHQFKKVQSCVRDIYVTSVEISRLPCVRFLLFWLVVEPTQSKNMSQKWTSSPEFGWKLLKNNWNRHHLVYTYCFSQQHRIWSWMGSWKAKAPIGAGVAVPYICR